MSKKKRGNGEGSIGFHQKSGLYRARYTVETSTGSKQKTVYGKTHREVDEKLTKAKADRNVGLVFDADNLKLEGGPIPDPVAGRQCERYGEAHHL